MRTQSTKTHQTIAIVVVIIAGLLTSSCRHYGNAIVGSTLDVRVTVADSTDDIVRMIKDSLAEKYSATSIADGYMVYHVTNGPARWVIVKAANAPRGLSMSNLYCYELENSEAWVLRSYVPIYEAMYTNSLDRHLSIQNDNDYIKVTFRGVVIATLATRKKQ